MWAHGQISCQLLSLLLILEEYLTKYTHGLHPVSLPIASSLDEYQTKQQAWPLG